MECAAMEKSITFTEQSLDESLIKRVKENRVASLSESRRACDEYGELLQFNINHNHRPPPISKKKKHPKIIHNGWWQGVTNNLLPSPHHFTSSPAASRPGSENQSRCKGERFCGDAGGSGSGLESRLHHGSTLKKQTNQPAGWHVLSNSEAAKDFLIYQWSSLAWTHGGKKAFQTVAENLSGLPGHFNCL